MIIWDKRKDRLCRGKKVVRRNGRIQVVSVSPEKEEGN